MAGYNYIPARDVLWYLVFVGFAVNYMASVDMNIAIVSMVHSSQSKSNNLSYSNECFHEQPNNNFTPANSISTNKERFHWNEKQQGLVLGALFWMSWVTQIPGGILAKRYGTKIVFGLSNFITCLLALLIPISARLDYRILIFIRVLQGFIAGPTWPSMHSLTANWIPPNERSKFVTAYLGGSVGTAITYPLYGLLISWFDWPSAFYTTGITGTIWFIAWWFLVFDTPTLHPRISETERAHILNSIGKTVTTEKPPIPWKKILTSVPVWMNVLANWGNLWGVLTLMVQGPTYFKFIHGWGIEMTGVLSGIPHMCRMVFAYIMSIVGDSLLQKNQMTRTNVRKLATAIGCIGQGGFTFALAFSGCNATAAIVCLTISIALSGSVSTGYIASFIDISPNFSGVIFGFSCTMCIMTGFISPLIVGSLTYENQTVGQWMIVYLITSAMLLIPGILYVCFSVSEIQEWNSPIQPLQSEEHLTLQDNTFTVKRYEDQLLHETEQ